jgi:hypothetical protein
MTARQVDVVLCSINALMSANSNQSRHADLKISAKLQDWCKFDSQGVNFILKLVENDI